MCFTKETAIGTAPPCTRQHHRVVVLLVFPGFIGLCAVEADAHVCSFGAGLWSIL